MGVPASERLRADKDFQKVRSFGDRLQCGPFIMNLQFEVDSKLPARLGIIASRRVGKAVKRNQGKRLIREIFREHKGGYPEGLNIVVVLRSDFDRHDFSELEARFCRSVDRFLDKQKQTFSGR